MADEKKKFTEEERRIAEEYGGFVDPQQQMAEEGKAKGQAVGGSIGTVAGGFAGSLVPGLGTMVGAGVGNLLGQAYGGMAGELIGFKKGADAYSKQMAEALDRGNAAIKRKDRALQSSIQQQVRDSRKKPKDKKMKQPGIVEYDADIMEMTGGAGSPDLSATDVAMRRYYG